MGEINTTESEEIKMCEETFEQAMWRWIHHLNNSLPNFKELMSAITEKDNNDE